MIVLGLNNLEKVEVVKKYIQEKEISKIFMISPEEFYFHFPDIDFVSYRNSIEYSCFYRLLQEINNNSLIILNECLRTKNRYDLTYNCIRHFLKQTQHQIIFQYLPFIDSINDFMILFDFDTQTKFKGQKFDKDLLDESFIICNKIDIEFNSIYVPVSNETKAKYAKTKNDLFLNIKDKDPHTLPRNLYLISGKEKLTYVKNEHHYVARNNRFKLANIIKYKEAMCREYDIFEFPHNHIDFNDFLFITKQTKFNVLVADTKTDYWYEKRYKDWNNKLKECYANISG